MNFLKKDEKELAKIEKRRRFEEERKKRIFDPKFRLIGVDVDALDKQRLEKWKNKETEEYESRKFAEKKLQEERLVLALERAQLEEKRKVEKDVVAFRNQFQNPRDRREFDLNDPDFLKKSKMEMVTRFEGEEGTSRFDLLKEQSKAWLLQQMMEKREREQLEKDRMAKFQETAHAVDQKAQELAHLETICQQKINEAVAEYNQIVAMENADRKRREEEEENRVNMQDIYNWSTGDFLTENPAQANSRALGRIIGFKYRGEPPSQRKVTQQIQAQQIHEKKITARVEEERNKVWDEYEQGINYQASILKQETLKAKREMERRRQEENDILAKYQKQREAVNNDIRELRPEPSFFEQFNKSTY